MNYQPAQIVGMPNLGQQFFKWGQGGPSGGDSWRPIPWPYLVGAMSIVAPPYGAPQMPNQPVVANQYPSDVNAVNVISIQGVIKQPTNQLIF